MMNKIILIGRLTADPELRYTTNNNAVAQFTLAVDRPYVKDGQKETDFIRIITWRKQAENCSKYLSKGRLVAVDGRLQIRSYEDRDGNRRTIAEVVANEVKFLESGSKRSEPSSDDFDVSDQDVPF